MTRKKMHHFLVALLQESLNCSSAELVVAEKEEHSERMSNYCVEMGLHLGYLCAIAEPHHSFKNEREKSDFWAAVGAIAGEAAIAFSENMNGVKKMDNLTVVNMKTVGSTILKWASHDNQAGLVSGMFHQKKKALIEKLKEDLAMEQEEPGYKNTDLMDSYLSEWAATRLERWEIEELKGPLKAKIFDPFSFMEKRVLSQQLPLSERSIKATL